MKIAFRLDADNHKGMGHANRCTVLAIELRLLGCKCVFFCHNHPELKQFLLERDFPLVSVPEMSLTEEIAWMQESLVGFDMIILDSYWLSDEYIATMNDKTRIVCCIDDNALYTYSCDAIINGNLHASELDYQFGEKKPHMLIGGRYCLLRHEFRYIEAIEINQQANRIFLCMGGSDSQNFTPRALLALQDIPNVEIVVALGPATRCDADVYQIARENLHIFKNPKDLLNLMRSCDIAVAAAGGMVYELAAIGLPSIIVTQADNQEKIAGYLDRHKLMQWCGNYTMQDMSLLRESCISLFGDYSRRKKESTALRNVVSSDGASRTACSLLGLGGKLPCHF